jgi:carbon storage regulator
MLVLSRKMKESIVINGNIVVTVVDIRGDKVRLGIEAPTEVPVHRREVYDALQRRGETHIQDGTAVAYTMPDAGKPEPPVEPQPIRSQQND